MGPRRKTEKNDPRKRNQRKKKFCPPQRTHPRTKRSRLNPIRKTRRGKPISGKDGKKMENGSGKGGDGSGCRTTPRLISLIRRLQTRLNLWRRKKRTNLAQRKRKSYPVRARRR